jgi:hypothetical protein
MKFKLWFENKINKALFLVHPDFALDNWPNIKYLNNLKKYYQDVKEFVDSFDGYILIHSFAPRHRNDKNGELGTGKQNIIEYEKFNNWMMNSKAKIVIEKKNICESPDELFNLIENLNENANVYWGGGYLGSCLTKTLNFIQDFESEINKKNIKFIPVKKLIYMPGSFPRTLDQSFEPDNIDTRNRNTAYDLGELPPLFQKSIRDDGIDPNVEKHLAKPFKSNPIGWSLFKY